MNIFHTILVYIHMCINSDASDINRMLYIIYNLF